MDDDDFDDAQNADDDAGGLSPDDIEAMFGEEDDVAPVSSMVDDGPGDDAEEDEDEEVEFDDLNEPEPIPQVFTTDEDDEDEEGEEGESKGALLKIILAVVLVLIIGLGGAAIFLRDTVIELIPGAEGFYHMIGLSDDSLGAGLAIKDVKSTRESIGGKDVLVVRGVISNVSEKVRPVPLLELKLSDLDGSMVQSEKTAPLKMELAAGDQIGFKIQVENPSALARRLEVTFTERAGGADAEQAPAAPAPATH